jgi:archaellum component FlaC
MSEFSNESAFKQASKIAEQIKLIEDNETLDDIMERAERISSAMELDLNSIYDSLNVVIDMINDPQARRAIEDIRDEIYRCMK